MTMKFPFCRALPAAVLLVSMAGADVAAQQPACSLYAFTGAAQSYVVPEGVGGLSITARGAQGASTGPGGTGGLGAEAFGVLSVTPGETLAVYVGGTNGFNGGGTGGLNGNSLNPGPSTGVAANGGGASDVRRLGSALANRVIVAGGGGGGGHDGVWGGCQPSPGANGGAGGAVAGAAGSGNACNCGGGGGAGGFPGTANAGGAAGSYVGTGCLRNTWTIGTAGALGLGGNGSTTFHNGTGGGGGGGGGYFGGGAGGSGSDTTPGGGGGGGSSYVGGVTNANLATGVRAGDGQIVICPNAPAPVTATAIPTIGEWMLIALGMLLSAFAFRHLRGRRLR